MTFRQLAFANVRGHALRYAAFFLSAAFSVLLFFVYAQVLLHPDLRTGYVYGAEGVVAGMIACEVLILAFSFWLVTWSQNAFLKARQQEFGLLSLLGTTRGQLRRLILIETALVASAAIAAGIGSGILLTKLFLMGLSRLLMVEVPLRFLVLPDAVVATVALFAVLFAVAGLASTVRIGRRTVVQLLRAAREPRPTPHASVPLALLGLVLVAVSYYVALSVRGANVVLAFVPTVITVTLGTHLLFTQASVFVLRGLRRVPRLYLSGTRLLVVSQLAFRVRDNARVLATVATLSAVVLTATGTFTIFSTEFREQNEALHPQALLVVEPGVAADAGAASGAGAEADASTDAGDAVDPTAVDALLTRHGVEPSARFDVPALHVPLQRPDGIQLESVVVMPLRAYREVVAATGATVLETGPFFFETSEADPAEGVAPPGPGEAWFVTPLAMSSQDEAPPDPAAFQPGGATEGTAVRAAFDARLLTERARTAPWLIVHDADFDRWWAAADPAARDRIHGWEWPDAANTVAFTRDLLALEANADPGLVADRFAGSRATRQTLSLTMFIGLFIAVLFFVGAGSLIYFKLFTELPDDTRLFRSLRRIGITAGEADRVVSLQMATVFFLPFVVGGLHALVALTALGHLLMADVTGWALLVVAIFALAQGAFFLLTRWTYLRTLRPAA